MLFPLCEVGAEEPHNVVIEYFQAGGEASCVLCGNEVQNEAGKSVYLPAGKWLDPFSGKIIAGRKTVVREYGLHETPLFLRLGALIPLAYEAHNTKEQKWDKLVYDFYPCKDSADSGYLYEDDTETTAYQYGQFRKSAFEAGYDVASNAFVIKLHAAEGSFSGEKAFETRKITIKYHLLKGAEGVKKVTVNGENVGFMKAKKNSSAFPLDTAESAADGGVIIMPVQTEIDQDYEIRFYL